MNENLLIVGAGVYGVVAKEIAESMGCFNKIAYIDDERKFTPCEENVIGTTKDIENLSIEYSNVIVAIGNPKVRITLLKKLEEICNIVSLISPKAYVAPSAKVMKGCIIEPMGVIQSGSVLATGCIISAGAVVNHASVLHEGVHVDCNAIVAGYSTVPKETKVDSGTVFFKENVEKSDVFYSNIKQESTR